MFTRKIFRRTLLMFLTVSILLFEVVGIAEIKLYTATGEDFPNNKENLEVAKQRAIENAVKKATKEAGVYIKQYSRSINSELTDDEVEVITSKTYKIVGTPKLTQDIINYSDDTQIIVLKATVEVKVDDSEVRKYIERDSKEKSILIEQTRQSNKASEENNRKIEDLREQYKRATSQIERDRIIKQMEQVDRDFLANQKVDEAWKLYYAKDYYGAIKLFREAIKLNPNNAYAYYGRGTAYDELKQHERAIQDFNKAIELNPNYDYAYNNRGVAYKNLGQYEQAIQDYNKAIELNPNLAEAYSNRGETYRNLKQYEWAIADYNKAIQLNPNNDIAYYNRGLAYDGLGQKERAIKDYNKTIELNPNFAMAYNNRGNAYYSLGQNKRAIQDYDKAIQLNPNLAIAYNNRGAAYYDLKQYELAISDYDKALKLLEHSIIYVNRGEANYYLKNYEQAFVDLNKAIEMGLDGKDLGEVLYYRGLCYQAIGNMSQAQADFTKAKELGYEG